MKRTIFLALLPAIALAGCAAPQQQARPGANPRATLPAAGLERVMGQDARTLEALFGPPDQDLRETGARRLVFTSPVCVLDAYLYPKPGAREAVVTWVDARLPDGEDMDRASCVAALSRR